MLLSSCWLFAGAIVAFLWSVSGLIRQGRRAMLSAYFVFSCGVWLLAAFRMVAFLPEPTDLLSVLPIPVIWSIGPALYVWFRRNVAGASAGVHRAHFLWVLPASLIAFLLYTGLPPGEGVKSKLLFISFLGAKLLIMAYLLIPVYSMLWILDRDLRIRYRPLIAMFLISFLTLLMGVLGSVPGLGLLRIWSALSLPALIMVGFLLGIHRPGLIHSLRDDFKAHRYMKSRLDGLDVPKILLQMRKLMEEEKPYLDEDFNLSALARELELSSHQVSEILNARMDCSFSDYVNGFRVRESLSLLREENDRTVLSIALAVGFNSRSAFHRAFKRFQGTTPQIYRNSI